MRIEVYSRDEMMEKIELGKFPKNVAVICFYDNKLKMMDKDYGPIDYGNVCDCVYSICLDDLDYFELEEEKVTYEDFFREAEEVARFVCEAHREERDFICQCEYGQGRSAGCAAAIMEHYCHNGISIFSDFRYYPNKIIYRKLFAELEKIKDV